MLDRDVPHERLVERREPPAPQARMQRHRHREPSPAHRLERTPPPPLQPHDGARDRDHARGGRRCVEQQHAHQPHQVAAILLLGCQPLHDQHETRAGRLRDLPRQPRLAAEGRAIQQPSAVDRLRTHTHHAGLVRAPQAPAGRAMPQQRGVERDERVVGGLHVHQARPHVRHRALRPYDRALGHRCWRSDDNIHGDAERRCECMVVADFFSEIQFVACRCILRSKAPDSVY